MFFKGHVERARIDVCNLGKMEVILGMPWLAAYNLEIDWEKGEVKMTCCPPICGKWGHMAKNCWERHKGRVVETSQELAKENRGQ